LKVLLAMPARVADAWLAAERQFSTRALLRHHPAAQTHKSGPCQFFEKLVPLGNMNR
jgi:hypothetical protein